MNSEIQIKNRLDMPALRSAENGAEFDLVDWLRTLWRGKIWILSVTILATLIGGYYAYKIAVPKYTAHASVALESREAQVVDLENVMSGLSGDQASINTEIEVLRSRGLIGKLVLKMNLVADPEFNTSLQVGSKFSVGNMRSMIFEPAEKKTPSDQQLFDATISTVLRAIRIANVSNSYVFSITAVTTNPEKSANMANTLAELYILDQLEVKFEATEQATAWLSDRVTTLQSELEIASNRVKDLSASTKLISVEALEALNRQIKDARDREENLNNSLVGQDKRLEELLAVLENGDRAEQARIADDPTLARIEKSEGPDKTFDARFELILRRAQLDVDRTTAQIASLAISVTELEADYSQQSKDLVELQQLEREAEASRLIYEYFLGRLKETSVQAGIQQADSRVLSRAAIPFSASAPRKSRVLAISILLGLLFGVFIVSMLEKLQNGFRSAEDIEALTGYTVVGQIPTIPGKARESKVRYLVDKPTSAAAEAIRNLRTSVLLANLDNPPKVIMLTSSIPGEGKTTTSMTLAQNFSGLGKKVLLVEGDIRKRVFAEYFDLKKDKGILSVISGESKFEDVVNRVDFLGIDVIIGEKSSTNAADVFSSEKFKDFMQDMRARYDIIILDTPPVLVVPDARVIAQVADAIVFGVRWDKTARNQVLDSLRQFEAVGIRASGIVLLQVDPKGMKRYGYGNRYGAYGSGYYEA